MLASQVIKKGLNSWLRQQGACSWKLYL